MNDNTTDLDTDASPSSLTQRPLAERQFRTHDGESLFYRHWPATGPARRGAIVLFHRGHEHGARMAHLVDELDLPDFDVFAWDAVSYTHLTLPTSDLV